MIPFYKTIEDNGIRNGFITVQKIVNVGETMASWKYIDRTGKTIELSYIRAEPENKGMGTQMMEYLLHVWKQKKIQKIVLTAENVRHVRWYATRFGFEIPIEERKELIQSLFHFHPEFKNEIINQWNIIFPNENRHYNYKEKLFQFVYQVIIGKIKILKLSESIYNEEGTKMELCLKYT